MPAPQQRPADREQLKWILRAAETSPTDVGKGFVNGVGMRQDYREALRWLRGAAAAGDAEAQYTLGVAYMRGFGTTRDSVEAHMWYNLAAAQGHVLAARARDNLTRRMTADQIDTAQRRAANFSAQPMLYNVAP